MISLSFPCCVVKEGLYLLRTWSLRVLWDDPDQNYCRKITRISCIKGTQWILQCSSEWIHLMNHDLSDLESLISKDCTLRSTCMMGLKGLLTWTNVYVACLGEDWCMTVVEFEIHRHMSQSTCSRFPRMTNHQILQN